MDWKVNGNTDPPHRRRKGWSFDFFSDSSETQVESRELPETSKNSEHYSLSQTQVGQQVWIVGFVGKGGMSRLLGMGLTPGIQVQVISAQPSGSVLVAIQDNRIGVGAGMAQKILVSNEPINNGETMNPPTQTLLREMAEGTKGRVVGYNQVLRGYKKKLLSMGMTPGVEFTIIRVAPLGDPVEILVRDFHLSLRKEEADALVVEKI
ncbi:MAG: FeoA family protein [Crocosphaera sp.]|nr:FeoA family protein [Crocosphaera sp.]